MVNFDELTSEEVRTCATLRILPNQYLEIKKTLLTAVETYGPFKKREAQTWFRIDVNKVITIAIILSISRFNRFASYMIGSRL